jgi:hypothetical protein
MRNFNFTIGHQTFIASEVANVTLNRRRVTEIEVREDCGSYYHQYRNGHVPRGADEKVIREYIREFYAQSQDEDDDYHAA